MSTVPFASLSLDAIAVILDRWGFDVRLAPIVRRAAGEGRLGLTPQRIVIDNVAYLPGYHYPPA